MDLLTTSEMAKKWSFTRRRVNVNGNLFSRDSGNK